VAPASDELLQHVLFALKHEGTDLLVLSHALRHVPAECMQDEVRQHPAGQFSRKAGFLWEHFNAATLEDTQPRGN
jgi:hypothetical protein